jgi:hypothetical protein
MVQNGHPEWALFVVLPFAVGIVWGDVWPFGHRGDAVIALIATSPFVGTLVVCAVLVVWSLEDLRGDVIRAVARALLYSFAVMFWGAVPAITGSLLAVALKRSGTPRKS